MKYLLVSLILFTTFCSCQKEKVTVSKLNPSIGERNELALVIDDSLWNSWVGDSIRKYIARPVEGLTKNEPMFDIIQFSPKIVTQKARTYRNIIDFKLQVNDTFVLDKSLYATPQNYFSIQGSSKENLINTLRQYSDSLVHVLYQSELNEEQHYINRLAIHNDSLFKSLIGSTIKIPMYYHLAMYTIDPFIWYQKSLSSGDVNLVLYEFPINYIERNGGSIEDHILLAKDSIGKHFIKGAKSFSYLKNDPKVSPKIRPFIKDQMQVYEIKGSWKMENDFFYGPYICYVFRDEYYQRYLFVEGFINDPYKLNRDHLLELEAIIQTINFYENDL